MSEDLHLSLDNFITTVGRESVRALFERTTPPSWPVFLERLYADLDDAIAKLEEIAHQLNDEGEEKLRTRIVHYLGAKDYSVVAEADHRGHTDILVTSHYLKMHWIAEAKLHEQYEGLAEGLRQLLTRYTSGTSSHDHCLLVFLRIKKAIQVPRTWRQRLKSFSGDIALKGEPKPITDWAFETCHEHVVSGLDVRVRHRFACVGYFPSDKSARASSVSSKSRSGAARAKGKSTKKRG